MALNDRQKRFVSEYVVDLNACEAAKRAGYSPKTADRIGSRLLAHVEVRGALEQAMNALQVRTNITQDRVLSEVRLIAFSDITHYTVDDFGNLAPAPGAPDGVMRAVSSVKRKTLLDGKGNIIGREVEFRLWDKPGVLKLAGKHVGLFPSRDKEAIDAAVEDKVKDMIAKARAQRAAAEQQKAVEPVSKVIDVEATPPPAEPGGSDGE